MVDYLRAALVLSKVVCLDRHTAAQQSYEKWKLVKFTGKSFKYVNLEMQSSTPSSCQRSVDLFTAKNGHMKLEVEGDLIFHLFLEVMIPAHMISCHKTKFFFLMHMKDESRPDCILLSLSAYAAKYADLMEKCFLVWKQDVTQM